MWNPTDRELKQLDEQVAQERKDRLQAVQELKDEFVLVDISRMK